MELGYKCNNKTTVFLNEFDVLLLVAILLTNLKLLIFLSTINIKQYFNDMLNFFYLYLKLNVYCCFYYLTTVMQ
ncbi:putative membrane protein [Orientia tsutsugamushi str. Gilliam]|uniref:Putative membrane protein n=1 Tax=Orientia tsutsugamushi str. Gilliam TaxID=1359184 RepID=A0A0F3MCU5_ORITS|nr:putative membrane protein [Orientia tsutsugamushi str. Gilliam]